MSNDVNGLKGTIENLPILIHSATNTESSFSINNLNDNAIHFVHKELVDNDIYIGDYQDNLQTLMQTDYIVVISLCGDIKSQILIATIQNEIICCNRITDDSFGGVRFTEISNDVIDMSEISDYIINLHKSFYSDKNIIWFGTDFDVPMGYTVSYQKI